MELGRKIGHLLAFAATLLCATSARATLHSIREVHSLNNAQAKRGIPVELEAVVTYSDPEWGLLFVEDDSGAIYVDVHGVGKPLLQGAKVRVTAVTGAGDVLPNLVHARVHFLGQGTVPRAPQLSLAQLDKGVGDSLYITTGGVLRTGEQTWNRVCFRIFDGSTWGLVIIPKQDSDAARALVGAKVHLKGVVGARLDATGKRLGTQLFVSSLADLAVEIPAIQASGNSVPTPIKMLSNSDATGRFVQQVRVRGTVIWEKLGLLFVDDGSATVAVQAGSNFHAALNSEVEVLGFPTLGRQGLVLSDVTVQTLRSAPGPVQIAPTKTTAADVLKSSLDRKRVQLRAKLIEQTSTPRETMFLLDDGTRRFRATLPRTAASEEIVWLHTNAVLDITGLALVRAATVDQPRSLLVFVGSPSDVVVVQDSGWLTLRTALWILGAIVLLTVVTLTWITQLRRTVQRQTAMIRARLERELNLETQYKRLFERNLAAVFRWHPNGTILDCNQAFANMLGFASSAELIGQSYWDRQVDVAAQQNLREALAGAGLTNRDANLVRANGSNVCLLENITTVETAEGTLYETTAIDVTQLRENQAELQRAKETAEHQALNDALTGLPNRRLLSLRMAHMLATARRELHKVALLYIDLDGFKLVNDSLGHTAGDALLIQVAARLQARVRASDTLARLGGDEFIVVLAGVHSRHESTRVAEDLLRVLSEPFSIEEHEVVVGASIGISIFPEHSDEPSDLLQNADSAMYAAKQEGRNRAIYFTSELGSSLRERRNLEQQLRGAIKRDEIAIHYQPEFSATTGNLIRFEALARWNHPTLGQIPPVKFIPIAEESGIIVSLGAYILERACSEAKAWQIEAARPIQLAVNLSNIQFRRENLADEVMEILRKTGFAPELLQLEITESVMMSGDTSCLDTMHKLRSFGIGLAIDDFGTGYSCLSSLQSYPFDTLKIDRSFLMELGIKAESEAMVDSVVTLAHNLGMRVIVEGVENEEQLQVIRKLGGDEVQGFLMGRPTANPLGVIAAQRLKHEPTLGREAAEYGELAVQGHSAHNRG